MLFDGALGLSSTAPANTPVRNGATTPTPSVATSDLPTANRVFISQRPMPTTFRRPPLKNITLSLLTSNDIGTTNFLCHQKIFS